MAGKNNYYNMFVNLVEYSCKAAHYLHDSLEQYDPNAVADKIKEIHAIEHAADNEKHDLMQKLVHEFITPIEREDIIELAQEIDEVTDTIEDVLMRFYMFCIVTPRKEALAFSSVIVQCCYGLKQALEELHNFHKSTTIHDYIVEVNKLEEDGDKLYMDAVHTLYATSKDSIEIMTWVEMFDRFEKCCDACEHVANEIESIIMKNS
jgi:predicted phosphate transport protein (TIGR00153 family)